MSRKMPEAWEGGRGGKGWSVRVVCLAGKGGERGKKKRTNIRHTNNLRRHGISWGRSGEKKEGSPGVIAAEGRKKGNAEILSLRPEFQRGGKKGGENDSCSYLDKKKRKIASLTGRKEAVHSSLDLDRKDRRSKCFTSQPCKGRGCLQSLRLGREKKKGGRGRRGGDSDSSDPVRKKQLQFLFFVSGEKRKKKTEDRKRDIFLNAPANTWAGGGEGGKRAEFSARRGKEGRKGEVFRQVVLLGYRGKRKRREGKEI